MQEVYSEISSSANYYKFFPRYILNYTAYQIYISVLPNTILESWSSFEAVHFHFAMNFTHEQLYF
jgi:hypothetical protein